MSVFLKNSEYLDILSEIAVALWNPALNFTTWACVFMNCASGRIEERTDTAAVSNSCFASCRSAPCYSFASTSSKANQTLLKGCEVTEEGALTFRTGSAAGSDINCSQNKSPDRESDIHNSAGVPMALRFVNFVAILALHNLGQGELVHNK
jgi:hypothetical protein